MKSKLRRRQILSALLLCVASSAMQTVCAAEEGFPNKLIRIIVSAAAGGNLDITTRALAVRMAETLGRSIVVENRAGGNSLPATRLVKDMPPDGYTLLVMSNTFVISPNFIASPGYDPLKDFVGVVSGKRINPATKSERLAGAPQFRA